jgi:hypothetical protein
MTFDWSDFIYPLTLLTMALAVFLGAFMGVALVATGHRLGRQHLFWQIAGGVVFFVPLAINRGLEGSVLWERFLANLVLWALFVAGMAFAGWLIRKVG